MAGYINIELISHRAAGESGTSGPGRGEGTRVPVTQSYMLYRALKDNGVTVQFVAYPIPGHAPVPPRFGNPIAIGAG